MAGKKRSLRPHVEEMGCNKLTWRIRRKSGIKFTWDALNVIISRAKNLFEEHKIRFGSWEPPQEPLRCCFGREKQSQKLPLGSVTIEEHAKQLRRMMLRTSETKHIEQLCRVSTPCIDDHQFEQRGTGNGGRIVKSLLSRRPENAFILACVTRHSMVCELTAFSRSQNGREFFWQTLGSLDFLHSQHAVITGSVAVLETLRNSADCDCFSLKTQSALGGNVVHFSRSNLCFQSGGHS